MPFRCIHSKIFYFYQQKFSIMSKYNSIFPYWSSLLLSEIKGLNKERQNTFTNRKQRHKHAFYFIKLKKNITMYWNGAVLWNNACFRLNMTSVSLIEAYRLYTIRIICNVVEMFKRLLCLIWIWEEWKVNVNYAI